MIIQVLIMVDATSGKIVDMTLRDTCAHYFYLIGIMVVPYMVVKIDIRVITQMPPTPLD